MCALFISGWCFFFLKKIPNISYVTEKILIDDSLSVFANTYKKNISIGKYLNKNKKINKNMKKKEHLEPTQEPQSNDCVKQQMPVHVFFGYANKCFKCRN